MRLPGLGPKTARRIWKELGVTTLAELKEAAEQQRLRALTGLGAKSEEKILAALAEEPRGPARVAAPARRRAAGRARASSRSCAQHPAAVKVSEAGIGAPPPRDLPRPRRDRDLHRPAGADRALHRAATGSPRSSRRATRRRRSITNDGLRFDLRVVPPECYGNLLQHFTGSKEHNVALREDAVRRGFSVSEYGVTNVETGEVFTRRDEEELYALLGYAYIPPELRENGGELAAARNGELPGARRARRPPRRPALPLDLVVDGKDIDRGDGVAPRRRSGYEYLAITDHSHYLRDGRLEAQWEEIDALNERARAVPDPEGDRGQHPGERRRSTWPTTSSTQLDWVVASVHTASTRTRPSGCCTRWRTRTSTASATSRAGGSASATRRRSRSSRSSRRALETGTFLEINSQPDRLDLRDAHARLAGEAGVTLVISSDAHSTKALALRRARRRRRRGAPG